MKFHTVILSSVVAATLVAGLPTGSRAEDAIEQAGVAVGVSAGNAWFLPLKIVSMSMGAVSGAVSYVVTGGNTELTRQIWHNTLAGPYVINREVARTGVGQRPELDTKTKAADNP